MRAEMYASHASTHQISSLLTLQARFCLHMCKENKELCRREQSTKFTKLAKKWPLQLWQRCCAVCPGWKAMAAQSSPGDRSLGMGFTIGVNVSKTCCKTHAGCKIQCFNASMSLCHPSPFFSWSIVGLRDWLLQQIMLTDKCLCSEAFAVGTTPWCRSEQCIESPGTSSDRR